jgi:hypothetical protein
MHPRLMLIMIDALTLDEAGLVEPSKQGTRDRSSVAQPCEIHNMEPR